jgi:hypothetical protein
VFALRVWILLLATVTAGTVAASSSKAVQAQDSCVFQLGFQTLRELIPDKVGDCHENERANAASGDSEQLTTGGLLVWRKADNWTAFTDGSVTWINGPEGLKTRPNNGPFFPWEAGPYGTSPSRQGGPVAGIAEGIGLRTLVQAIETTGPYAHMILGVVLFILVVVALGTERGFMKISGVVVGPLALFAAWAMAELSRDNRLVTLLLALAIVVGFGLLVWAYMKGTAGLPKRAVFSFFGPRRRRYLKYLTRGRSQARPSPEALVSQRRRPNMADPSRRRTGR